MERPQPNKLEYIKHLFRARFDGEVRHSETGELLNVYDPHYETLEEFDLSGVYEHYKSTPNDRKLYFVDSVRRNIDSGECLVVYIPLYETEDQSIPARPLSLFTGSVEVDGQEVPRFRYLGSHLEDN